MSPIPKLGQGKVGHRTSNKELLVDQPVLQNFRTHQDDERDVGLRGAVLKVGVGFVAMRRSFLLHDQQQDLKRLSKKRLNFANLLTMEI